ncbi:hypothetical protein BDW62DRAFT_185649 [Aspergillus aurantiobrunneus]
MPTDPRHFILTMSDHQERGSSDESSPSNPQHKPDDDDKAPTGSGHDNQDTQTLASRIQKSASGLARNAFLSSTPSGDTAHVLSDGSKAAPSSSSSALGAAEHYGATIGPSSSSSSRDQTTHGSAETFRSPTTQPGGFELPGLTENEFQNSYGRDLSGAIDDLSKGKDKIKESDTGSRLTGHLDGMTATATLNPSDGDAVVSMLTDQTFDPGFPPSANEPPEYLETELLPPRLTPAEIQMIESFRRQLPPESSTRPRHNPEQSHQLSSFSLVPDIGSFLDTIPAPSADDPSTIHATSLRDTVLTSLPGAADWISVEEKYHDEVWGYLKPTLEAAAKEIESSKDSSTAEDGPAVRRLKMILKHMQH